MSEMGMVITQPNPSHEHVDPAMLTRPTRLTAKQIKTSVFILLWHSSSTMKSLAKNNNTQSLNPTHHSVIEPNPT